eukprot:CAMPEP_0172480810 /NCGR_PEP_ID=MMETSP1066-20121228/6258_1 /TAXON_ID=671091 /ORGANISM="Coscinodiscus wailesii, Strain CCMP2513" /LENGTH=407 /DNA_ID=CAMNT_0013242503 /DNA_START=49 /DNA_END=1272 /DNA_ORIENTATION=-
MASEAASPKNPLIAVNYGIILSLWTGAQLIDIPYTINVLVLVTAILYVSCHSSIELLNLSSPEGDDGSPDSDKKKSQVMMEGVEVLKKEDAMQFPLVGSASLFGLYLAFKFFDREVVNLIISFYFAAVGCAAMTMTIAPFIEAAVLPLKRRFKKEILIPHPLPEFVGGPTPWDCSIDASIAEMISFLGSAVFCGFYFKLKHWAMNNVLGICFCLQGISKFSLGTYKIGAILLIGLFFYDIFWVFGTDVMVTVAKNLDGPIKILFPRSLTPNPETNKIELSLLGLGDIVLPGFFLALLLRFDAHRAGSCDMYGIFPKPYFHSGLVAYVIGLATTLFVMIYFEAAQPALLYLVPACLGSSFICAIIKGETKELLDYSEEDEGGDEEEEGETKDKVGDIKGKNEDAKKAD